MDDAIKLIHKIRPDVKIHETARENSYFLKLLQNIRQNIPIILQTYIQTCNLAFSLPISCTNYAIVSKRGK